MPPKNVADAQEAESRARAEAGAEPALAQAAEVIDDAPRGDPSPDAQRQAQPAETPEPAPPRRELPPSELRRQAIIDRFTTERRAQAQVEADQISEFQRSGMPPEFEVFQDLQQPAAQVESPPLVPEQEPEPAVEAEPAQQQQQAAPEPRTIKVKVNGQERELPIEEVIAKAQIALASEGILEQAKQLRNDYLALRGQTNTDPRSVQPGHQAGQPQGGHQASEQQRTQPAAEAQPNVSEATLQPNQPELAKLIESLQFGDPAEAAALLQDTIDRRSQAGVAQAVEQALQTQRLKDEGARATKQLADFMDQHQELAADPMAKAAMEYRIFELQREDLQALGVDPEQIHNPHTNLRGAPADIAMAHRWYRSQGMNLRSPKDMLETATEDFLKWKGVAKPNATPADPANKAPPRVDVTVDRTARRAAIPQQPSRAAAPVRAAIQPTATQPRDRSDIVEQMKQRTKGQPRKGGASVPA